MAPNCLLAYTTMVDGFGALKAMLKLTHPTLSMNQPPTNAPILSDAQYIQTYKQSLKNF